MEKILIIESELVSKIICSELRGLVVNYSRRSPESGFLLKAAHQSSSPSIWKIHAIAVDWIFYREKLFLADCDSDNSVVDEMMDDLLGREFLSTRITDDGRFRIIFSGDRYLDITDPKTDDDLYWAVRHADRWLISFSREGLKFMDIGRKAKA